jgi:hypothetical protein
VRITVRKNAKRRKVWIYGLYDPRNNVLRYVGQTPSPRNRWRQHCGGNGGNAELNAWLLELKAAGLKPEMQLFGIVIGFSGNVLIDESMSNGAESKTIGHCYRVRGGRDTLLNVRGTPKLGKLRKSQYARMYG